MAQKEKLEHIAFIMDGNGRWATKNNKERIMGHLEGTKIVPKIILSCKEQSINFISFFTFSTENWNRPKKEVEFLLKIFEEKISEKTFKWAIKNKVKIIFVGFQEKFSDSLNDKIKEFSEKEYDYEVTVGIYFNYGSQQEILLAAKKMNDSKLDYTIENFNKCLLTKDFPNVDLLIRTSGENRISNFLLWQIAYSEIIFEETLWPDYNETIFKKNLVEYYKRIRRFGGL